MQTSSDRTDGAQSQPRWIAAVGAPWQDVAWDVKDPNGTTSRADSLRWELFLPASPGGAPLDPLNRETMEVRTGVHPVTGAALGGAEARQNAINGFDRTFTVGDGVADDLQHACLLFFPEPHRCDDPTFSCLCPVSAEPIDAGAGGTFLDPSCTTLESGDVVQHGDKVFPGTRLMEVARALGRQAVLGSVCARNVADPMRFDFGMRPLLGALSLRSSISVP